MDIQELKKIVDSMGNLIITDEEFQEAADMVKAVASTTDDQKLQMYGLFKTVTVGKVNTSRPWGIDLVGCAKWDAWKSYEDWDKDKAKLGYVVVVRKICGGEMPGGASNSDGGLGKSTSTPSEMEGANTTPWGEKDELFKAIVDNKPDEALRLLTEKQVDPNRVSDDEFGMTPLHYAADRGDAHIAQMLLSHGALANSVDADGNIPLYHAVICEHEEVIQVLMDGGSDIHQTNKEGCAITSMDDIPEKIRALLGL